MISYLSINTWKGIRADKNNDGKLDFREIQALCHTLNLKISERALRQKYKVNIL